MNINEILISSGITSGIYILYKGINHYRLQSSCNSNNELVISVVDIEKQSEKPKENAELSIVVDNPKQ